MWTSGLGSREPSDNGQFLRQEKKLSRRTAVLTAAHPELPKSGVDWAATMTHTTSTLPC
jgi:hypothetical protein